MTGVIGFADLVAATAAIATWVAVTASGPDRPLLSGGDCSLLPGVFAGLRRAGIDAGLWMVDGHPDAYDGASSPTGEAADMDLTFLLGGAPPALAEVWGGDDPPLLEPARVAVLGHRPAGVRSRGGGASSTRVPAGVVLVDARRSSSAARPRWLPRAPRCSPARPAWLHLDLDALDAAVFPAASYPQPNGLDWDSFAQLVRPLAAAESLAGISVADLNPDRDPDGAGTRRVVGLLAELLG